MVKILSLHLLAGLMLFAATHLRFTPKNYFGDCGLKIITYASFYEGPGKDIFSQYEEEFLCQMQVQVLKTAGMLAQVKNLNTEYDVIIGLDDYQLDEMDLGAYLVEDLDFQHEKYALEKYKTYYDQGAFKMDSAPLTFFLKLQTLPQDEEGRIKGFYTFEDLLKFLTDNKIKVAIPSPNTSVLGSLYLNWILDHVKEAQEFLSQPTWVYVGSWTEAFGLFEKSLVKGFLSYETSEIHFQQQNEKLLEKHKGSEDQPVTQVFKVEMQAGHPNYIEYFLVSQKTKTDKEDKYRFVRYMYRQDVQSKLLSKNYMWPIIDAEQKHSAMERKIELVPLKKRLSRSEILKSWKELK